MRSPIVLVGSSAAALACGGLAPAPLTVGQVERDVALEAADVAAFSPGLTFDAAKETWRYERVWDGGTELEYTYENFDGADSMLMVSTLAYVEPTAEDASWVMTGTGIGLGLADTQGVQLVETPGLLTWGEENDCRLFVVDGMNWGTMCAARKGRRVYVATVAGVAFDQPGSMDVLLASQLAAFDNWNP
jgi:hypothetical protein